MSTLNAVESGFDVGAAHRIVANMTLFSPTEGGPCSFTATFPKAAATPPARAMIGNLSRDLPGGAKQSYSISVMAKTAAEVVLPLGAFTGRRVGYTVDDTRTVAINVQSLDGYGINESWHLDLNIVVLPTSTTDFQLRGGANMTIDSVDVTP